MRKVAERKNQLKSVEAKLLQLSQTKENKEQALKMLERKLVALLEAQENELAEIRRRQDLKCDDRVNINQKLLPPTPQKPTHFQPQPVAPTASVVYDNRKTAQLMDSTETMMKFGFTSMTMTYFTALNMVKALKSMSTKEMDISKLSDSISSTINLPSIENQSDRNVYTRKAKSSVLTWGVDHVIEWLQVLSLPQYEDSFRDGSIDGPFLCQLTDDDLMNVLGVEHKLHRKKILFGISQLQYTSKGQQNDVDETSLPGTPASSLLIVSTFFLNTLVTNLSESLKIYLSNNFEG